MFKRKKIVTVIEMGASKAVVVLARCSSDDDKFDILGYSVNNTSQSIIKGEIADANKAFTIVEKTIKEAVRNAQVAIDPRYIFFNITACEISSEKSSGQIIIKSDHSQVTEKDVREAINVARENNSKLYSSRYSLQAFTNCFFLDDDKRVADAVGEFTHKLTAVVCSVFANSNRVEPFMKLFSDLDYDEDITFMFSGISSAWGVLTESSEDRENGALVLDFGAGTVEYTVLFKKTVLLAKVLPVGINHIINDVKIAFDLPFNVAKKIVCDSDYLEMKKNGEVYYNVQCNEQKIKRLLLEELEKVINLRIYEIFSIINNELVDLNIKGALDNGVILTGGGALIKAIENSCSDIFDLPQRIGRPLDSTNIPKELYSPQFSSSLGLLHLVCGNQDNFLKQERHNVLMRTVHAVDNASHSFVESLADKIKAFKI